MNARGYPRPEIALDKLERRFYNLKSLLRMAQSQLPTRKQFKQFKQFKPVMPDHRGLPATSDSSILGQLRHARAKIEHDLKNNLARQDSLKFEQEHLEGELTEFKNAIEVLEHH